MAPEFWVARLNPADASAVWPKVLPMLGKAIAGSDGLFRPEDVEALVTAPNAGTLHGWSLWIAADRDRLLCAWTTKVQFFPRGRVLEVVFGGGTNMKSYYQFGLSELEKFAAELGCTRLRCGGRRGWEKFGWASIGRLHERKFA